MLRPSCSGDGDTTVRCPSCGCERTGRVRNARATRIIPEQIAEAQRLARAWDAAHPREPLAPSRLNRRDVALKGLSAAARADLDWLARFEREAKVLASLNHPNIGSIYGLEEAGGHCQVAGE